MLVHIKSSNPICYKGRAETKILERVINKRPLKGVVESFFEVDEK